MIYVADTKEELETFVHAWADAAGFPFPCDQFKGDPEPMRAAWLKASPAERDAMAQEYADAGWTLRPAEILPEAKGDRFYLEAPDDLAEVVKPMAETHFGRELKPEQIAALDGSAAKLTEDFPADWKAKDFGVADADLAALGLTRTKVAAALDVKAEDNKP